MKLSEWVGWFLAACVVLLVTGLLAAELRDEHARTARRAHPTACEAPGFDASGFPRCHDGITP